MSLRSQMQYPASAALQAIAHVFITGFEFVALAVLLRRFGGVAGWTLAEVGLLYGMVSIAFALAESLARGFDIFSTLVRSGDFDRVLVRPRSAALQVMGTEIQLRYAGRLAQGLLVLAWACHALDIPWSIARAALLVAAIGGGACLFAGLFVLQATLAFWTVESLEIANVATYGGVEAAKMPLSIYPRWLRSVFTFVIPLATINYLPAHAILGRVRAVEIPASLPWLSPLAGVVFLGVALQAWEIGVRHYRSTGS
jgi:ABC-2 type transport system permease protein